MKGKMFKKLFTIGLAVCILVISLAACGSNDKKTDVKSTEIPKSSDVTKATETEVDKSKQVELVFYLYGDAPTDMKKVEEKINEVLLEKINATVSFRFTTYTDHMTKYKMVLSSGEDCDLIYTANWMEYKNLASKQAFLPLNELLDTTIPGIKTLFTDEVWNQVKVNDSIYAVPHAGNTSYSTQLVVWREDLRKKYNLPTPDSFENMEAYLDGIKKNDPKQQLIAADLATSTTSTFKTFGGVAYKTSYSPYTKGYYSLDVDYSNPSKLFDYWHSDLFVEDMKAMKRWADKGFWSKNILSHLPEGDIGNGGEVVTLCNSGQYIAYRDTANEAHPDWELAYLTRADLTGVVYPSIPFTDCTSIPINSKNPERAAMALELFLTDAELQRLLLYGFEGEHYTVDANGYYVEGPQNANYTYEGSNAWNMKNKDIILGKESSEKLNSINEKLAEQAANCGYPQVDFLSGFLEDYSAYSAERAALVSVLVEYLTPLQAGMVKDVDAAIEEFLEKAETAGLSKIQNAYKDQWAAYCKEYGY